MANVKVKFLRSHPKFGYFAGDETELSAKVAEELIGSKHVQEVGAKSEKKEAPEPEKTVVKAAEVHTRTGHKPHKK